MSNLDYTAILINQEPLLPSVMSPRSEIGL